MRVAVVAEWYPSPGDPVLGIWAHRQAVAARDAGADVRVLALRRAPAGDPTVYRVDGTEVALRKDTARLIHIHSVFVADRKVAR